MVIGEFTAGVRMLLEKGLSRHHISEDKQLSENTHKFLFGQKTKVARRRG
jgi:orotate phosphoribosyltransferase-like protein